MTVVRRPIGTWSSTVAEWPVDSVRVCRYRSPVAAVAVSLACLPEAKYVSIALTPALAPRRLGGAAPPPLATSPWPTYNDTPNSSGGCVGADPVRATSRSSGCGRPS